MKRIILGALAVVLAIAGSAFTSPHAARFTNYFFPLDPTSGVVQTITTSASTPPTSNLTGCVASDAHFCSGVYSTYHTVVVGGQNRFTATGNRGTTYKKP